MFDLRRNHILQALLVVLIAWFVYVLRDVIIVVFVAFLFTVVLRPSVAWLERHHMPVAVAVLLPILVLLGFLVLIGIFVVPSFIDEGKQFVARLPSYLHSIERSGQLKSLHFNISELQNDLRGHFDALTNTLVSVTTTVVTIVAGAITTLVIMLYWLGTYDRTKETLLTFAPRAHRDRARDIWHRVEKKLVSWAKAQVLLSLVVGVSVWIGALIIGLPFPAALGIIAGLLESIPTLGAIISAIPGILLGLSVSVETGIWAIVLYLFVHQVENHILVPYLFGRTVRLHPIIVIISLLIGAVLYGVLGAILSLPAALCISAVVDSFRDDQTKVTSKQPSKLLSQKG